MQPRFVFLVVFQHVLMTGPSLYLNGVEMIRLHMHDRHGHPRQLANNGAAVEVSRAGDVTIAQRWRSTMSIC